METCCWKINGRIGGDQLTGAVKLTVGDELTGRGSYALINKSSLELRFLDDKINEYLV